MGVEVKAEIERLAGELKKPTPVAIAHQLNYRPATVWWFNTRGLLEWTIRHRPRWSVRWTPGLETVGSSSCGTPTLVIARWPLRWP
jgi:hypothetical protein